MRGDDLQIDDFAHSHIYCGDLQTDDFAHSHIYCGDLQNVEDSHIHCDDLQIDEFAHTVVTSRVTIYKMLKIVISIVTIYK